MSDQPNQATGAHSSSVLAIASRGGPDAERAGQSTTAALAFLIDAPLQSWGVASKFQRRDTAGWPSKSALVGLVAAAMGIDKHAPDEGERLAPLAALRFGVFHWPKSRRDRPDKTIATGRLADFHTIGGGYDKTRPGERLHIPSKAGDGSPFGTVITRRTYLLDSRFIAVFDGNRGLLEKAAAALMDPVWGLWFGRKTCLPAAPLSPVVQTTRLAALCAVLTAHGGAPELAAALEGRAEDEGPGADWHADQPVAFGLHHGAVPTSYIPRPVRRITGAELT
ncbi:MAG: type I-E CRISPR-associated protein Cas5/CasD [Akkermansiaceae bacterium]|jgi:CRISPR system Cascade subunit CasD|nr:type I-E CRISPR-associated protein Cas5/CasD [Akkermansiaceae bacterium]